MKDTPSQNFRNDAAMSLMRDAINDQPYVAESNVMEGVWDTAVSTVLTEAPAASTLFYGGLRLLEQDVGEVDDNFNPYRHFYDNEERYEDLRTSHNAGRFADAVNERHFDLIAQRYREELTHRDRMQNGSTGGLVLGSALSMLDLTSFIPFVGQVSAASRANKLREAVLGVTKAGAAGGAYVAGSEAILHANQEFRTAEESATNIALGAAIVGGLGIVSRAAQMPYSKWNPSNPDHPLKVDPKKAPPNRVTDRRPGEDIEQAKARSYEVPDSVGAARSEEYLHKVRGVDERGRVRTLAASFLERATPGQRVMHSLSSKARGLGYEMIDNPGVITDAMEAGQATKTIEGIKSLEMAEIRDVKRVADEALIKVNQTVAQLNGKRAPGAVGRTARTAGARLGNFAKAAVGGQENIRLGQVQPWEFNEYIVRTMFDRVDDATINDLVAKTGSREGAEVVVNAAKEQANNIKAAFQKREKKLIDAGLLSEEDALGDRFVMHQHWNPKLIASRHSEFTGWLLEKLREQPTDDYLTDRWGMTRSEFDKLGKEEVTTKRIASRDAKNAANRERNRDDLPLKEETVSPEEGVLLKKRVLEDWHGTNEEYEYDQAVLNYQKEKVKANQLKHELLYHLREVGKANTEIRSTKLRDLKASLNLKKQEQGFFKAETDKLKAERRQLVKAAEAARQKTLDRKLANTGDVGEQSTDTSLDITQTIRERNGKVTAKRVKAPESTKLTEIKGRLAEIDKQIKQLKKESKQFASRIDQAENVLTRIRKANGAADRHRDAAKQYASELSDQLKDVNKGLRKGRAQVRRLEKRTPLIDAVDSMVTNLTQNRHFPASILKDTDLETTAGALKMRHINLNPDDMYEAMSRGFMNKDVWEGIERAGEPLAADLAFKAKGYSNGLEDEINEIYEEYTQAIDKARTEGRTKKEIASIEGERDRIVKDVRALRDRLKGVYGLPEDPDSVINWSFDRLREMNYVSFGVGFVLSSLTDLASMGLNALGGMRSLSPKVWKSANRMAREGSHEDVRRLVYATERVMHNSRIAQLAGTDHISDGMGLGAVGSNTQKVTSMVERGLRGASESIGVLSGMMKWNSHLKMMAMIEMQDNLYRNIDSYVNLFDDAKNLVGKDAVLRDKLVQAGLGQTELRRIQRMMKKYPPHVGEAAELDSHRWLSDPEGNEAFDDLNYAMRAIANRSIPTPGVGDTPLLMSNVFGKVWLQFQTYSFVFINQFMKPAGHRMFHHKDGEAWFNLMMLTALGGGVVVMKDALKGRDLSERSNEQWVMDVIDRSGLMVYFSPYVGLFSQAVLGETPSRYYGNTFGNQILGPSFSRFTDVGSVGMTAVDPDEDVTWAQAKRLLPYKPLIDLTERALTDE